MTRYFLEMAYHGRRYAGFQAQANACTIQGEIDRAVGILVKHPVLTTGSSRTDAGVHASQNFVHFDTEHSLHPQFLYKLNAILPRDIAVRAVYRVHPGVHARFTAVARSYEYMVSRVKDPFLQDFAYYFPYRIDLDSMQEAAAAVCAQKDFTSFSKRNTQVRTFICNIAAAGWTQEGDTLKFRICANRFLRGMVRGLVGTMLQVGRGKMNIEGLGRIFEGKDCSKADFSAPAQGLFLRAVSYPEGTLNDKLFDIGEALRDPFQG